MFRSAFICALLGLSVAAQAQSYPTPTFQSVITANDVRFYGADPTAAKDSAPAFRSAIAYAVAQGGGTVLVPPGSYLLDTSSSGPIAISGVVTLRCEGNYPAGVGFAGQLLQATDSGDFFTMTGSSSRIIGCQFGPNHYIPTNGYTIRVQNGCFLCSIENIVVQYMWRGIAVGRSADFKIDTVYGSNLFSPVLIYLGGQPDNVGGNNTCCARISRIVANNPWPVSVSPLNRVTWAQNLAVTVGQWAYINGSLYGVTQAGTTASTGTGPSGYPPGVTTPAAVWSTAINDGTAQWKYEATCPPEDGKTAWVVMDSWAATLRIDHAELLSGCTGLSMIDSLNTGVSQPLFAEFNDVELERNFYNTMYLHAGGMLQEVNGYASISLSQAGIRIDPGFGGAMFSNMLVNNNSTHGFWLRGGVATSITNSQIYLNNNGTGLSGSANNIAIAPGVSNFSITNDFIGLVAVPGTPPAPRTGYGVLINSGASDYYVVTGNICSGMNTLGCVSDAGTGTHKTVSGNW